jgi:hypothetical protein
MLRLRLLGSVALLLPFVLAHCAADTTDGGDDVGATGDSALSTTIHSSYGVTMFGGAGDFQAMSCGLSSKTAQQSHPWYVASSQRYGCKVNLKIVTAGGRCVVASTEDAGPASAVERKAGIAVLDSSPAVVAQLFPNETQGLGWKDLKAHPGKYEVTVTRTTLPLGPCDPSDE